MCFSVAWSCKQKYFILDDVTYRILRGITMILQSSTLLSFKSTVDKESNNCGTTNSRSESCVHTSVSASVGPWPGPPVRALSCFCWVELELTDPNGAFWDSQGCSTGIWLRLCAWACRGSWHALLLSSWAAVVAMPVSTPFCTGEEKTAGWTGWADGTCSRWLSWGT